MNASGTYYVNGSAVPEDQVARYLPIFEQAKIENDQSGKSLRQKLQNNSQSGEDNAKADRLLKAIKKAATDTSSSLKN